MTGAADGEPLPRWWTAAAALAALGVALRAIAFDAFAVHHPDEAFQYLEQAHRLVFGYGVVPWEYRYGMRSWLPPLLLSGPMRLGAALDPTGLGWIVAPRLAAAALAATAMASAFTIGARRSALHALLALGVTAVWFEGVYFGVHVLTETLAVAAFLAAAALDPGAEPGRGRLAATGALLGLCVVLRFHYAPAVAAYALVAHGPAPRRWPWLALGAAGVLAASAAVDVAMGQPPFGWALASVRMNVVEGRASNYGVSGPLEYLVMLLGQWRLAMLPILVLAGVGARRAPALAAAAVVNLVVHSLIGHKEYRFILLTTTLVVLLAALGTADAVAWVRARVPRMRSPALPAAVALGAWALVSAALAATPVMGAMWRRADPQTRIMREAGRVPGVCGVALDDLPPWDSGGYAYLHRDVPIYLTRWRDSERMAPRAFAPASAAFDAVIAAPGAALPEPFRPIVCRGGKQAVCLYVRPGGCAPSPAAEPWRLDRVLLRHDA